MLISFGDKTSTSNALCLHLVKILLLCLQHQQDLPKVAEPMTVGLRRDSLNIVHKMKTLHCLLNLLH